jgi:hypothetical protein
VARENHRVPMPQAGRWREILNSDAGDYGGSGCRQPGDGRRDAPTRGQISAEMVCRRCRPAAEWSRSSLPRLEEKAAKPAAKKKVSSRKKVVEEATA